ncbi:phospholipase D family protein [Bradyrhizobium sp. 2TAF36]|uniref:phospholipase D family protein n=1 Tax=unclassified Bradyrhizobium TaxID=2631580 RepID=UPI0014314081|nr:phospholipase D family protein [Bradyrhizobium sp. MOS001]
MDVDTQRTSSPGSSAESQASARRGLPRTALIWLAEVLTGRTTDPRPDYPRTPSTAFEDPASTRLGQFFGLAADQHPGLSGFSLLSQGREAFIARLALTDLAERGLDMQYYVWDGDTTGRIIIEHVMKAADRGVRVRLLVDDPFYKDSDSVKAGLDAHPNVEIRLFNPLTNRRWSFLDFIFDFGRVNRRMHNKLMVADNAAAIVGGRNIGDIYYGVNTFANYRDLDVLAAGPVVRDLSGVFDRYWNSPSTVPIAAIVDRAHDAADLDAIRIRLREAIAAADYPYPIDQELDQLAARGAELRDNLVWAHGRIVADDPESIAPGKESDDVIEFIRGRVAQLKEELLVESPYFVLPARAQATVKALQERNVRVRVLTNSLASNDMLPAHSGYAKTRRRLLENGMELYELRPDTDAFRLGWSILSERSRAALHAKAMAFDGEAVFIGSFNLDPRSAVINTEAGLYIESPELAKRLTAYMAAGVVPANSYRVFLDPKGDIIWETERNGQRVRYRDEPETGFRRRFVADLWKLLPIDSQL